MSKSAAAHVATPVQATIRMGDVASAAAGLLASLAPAEPELVLIFASPSATLPVLATELRKGLPAACRIAGCSSAGELSGEGYSNGTAVAIGFPALSFRSEVLVLGCATEAGHITLLAPDAYAPDGARIH